MAGLTYRITTLGCRVNHAESREIASDLLARGLQPAGCGQPADVEVVHTCTVTHTAAAKSRQAIRRARRRAQPTPLSRPTSLDSAASGAAPGEPLILVTGCYASSDRTPASRVAGAPDRIIEHEHPSGTGMIERVRERIDEWLNGRPQPAAIEAGDHGATRGEVLPLPVTEPVTHSSPHIRAELRIQDGCDAHCTFCIIPKIRRTLRSKTVPDAVDEAARLVAIGHKEIVLTGIFIGAYWHETALRRKQRHRYASPLADLVDAVARVHGLERLRISSMEPGDVDEPLLDAMVANQPVVVPHLHLPLQSGSDAILRRMNRQYRVGEYVEMIDRVNEALTFDHLPPAITTDIICGFPGETEDDFEQTEGLARQIGYLHMHVFPFSPREGTAAARWTDQFVPGPVRRQRVQRLIDLERDPHTGLAAAFTRRLLGRTVRVILEQPDARRTGWMRGRCDHYVPVRLRTDLPRGSVVRVRIDQVDSKGACGVLENRDRALPIAV